MESLPPVAGGLTFGEWLKAKPNLLNKVGTSRLDKCVPWKS